jgi:hypothetical protein
MTNIKEKSNKEDVQLHIKKAFEIIEEHLPDSYVPEVLEKLPSNTEITASIIRNIRNKRAKGISTNYLCVVNAMVEVANDCKLQKEKLIENIS